MFTKINADCERRITNLEAAVNSLTATVNKAIGGIAIIAFALGTVTGIRELIRVLTSSIK